MIKTVQAKKAIVCLFETLRFWSQPYLTDYPVVLFVVPLNQTLLDKNK
jgi:hypothetical protein